MSPRPVSEPPHNPTCPLVDAGDGVYLPCIRPYGHDGPHLADEIKEAQ